MEVRAAGGYQPEVADDVQIKLAVGTGLRGVKDLNAAQAGLLQLADDVVENVRLEFGVYRVRHNRGGAVAADEVYNLRGGGGAVFDKSDAAAGENDFVCFFGVLDIAFFEQDVGEMRTADLRARVAVFVQGDFFIGDVDAEILQQLDAAVRHLVAAREFVLLIFAERGQGFFGNVQREDFHFRAGIKYRKFSAVDDFYFAVFGGGRMQLVQSRNGVMVGQRQRFQPDFFGGVQEFGRRKKAVGGGGVGVQIYHGGAVP